MEMKQLGWLFILFGLAGLLVNYQTGTLPYMLWFCNHMSFIVGVAILFRSPFWVGAELAVGLIPQMLWTVDFLSRLFFSAHWLGGFTSYMFSPDYAPALYYLSLNHLYLAPLSLWIAYRWGIPQAAWRGALLHGLLIMPFSYLLPAYNLNCLNRACAPWLASTWYPALAPLLFLLVIFLTHVLLYSVFAKDK